MYGTIQFTVLGLGVATKRNLTGFTPKVKVISELEAKHLRIYVRSNAAFLRQRAFPALVWMFVTHTDAGFLPHVRLT